MIACRKVDAYAMIPSNNNKRIAKNTIILYVRMVFFLIIKLYTARIILDVLGIVDYGIYNLVASIIILFSFLNAAMNGTSQRFFNVAIGLKDKHLLKKYFINSVNTHFIIGICSAIIIEIIGLWLLKEKLNIPNERYGAALFVFHISVITCFITIIRTPYNAIIIAYERMSFYAYNSIFEAALNLVILFPLKYLDCDRLMLYSLLSMLVSLLITVVYILFCNRCYHACQYKYSYSDKAVIKEILLFSSWSTLSSIANIGVKQVLNILLNLFHGILLNATVAIMNQVSSAIYGFIQNFQLALNPQLIQKYVSKEWNDMKTLLYFASRISFLLLMILSLPILLCMNEILHIWLKTVPDYASEFCVLSILALLVNTIGGPIWTLIQASGDIKRYQISISIVTFLNIPIYYLLLMYDISPEYCLYTPILTNIIVVVIGFLTINKKVQITIKDYFNNVICPITKASTIGIIVPISMKIIIDVNTGLMSMNQTIALIIISLLSVSMAAFRYGLVQNERKMIIHKIKSILY